METRVVEAALVKIASLSKVALGDAGMDILSVNLKGGSEFNRKNITTIFSCVFNLKYSLEFLNICGVSWNFGTEIYL